MIYFFSERMFKNANLMELHLVSTAILDWCITGRRLDGSAVRLEKALESESEWALLARYVYTYKAFVIVAKLHSATEWQQQDRTQTTKEQYTNRQCTK